ncbi:MAG: hypothetical protein AAFN30_02180 [Actinomycetota bacterium]
MNAPTTSSRPPVAVLVLAGAALLVVGLLLAQAAIGLFIRLVQLVLIVVAFAAMAFVGLYLWRKGDIGPPDQAD